MSKATEAAKLIRQIAADNSHGYAWGGNGPGDFDCSGLVNYVWQSVGVPVNREVRNTTHTMKTYYCRHGFSDVTGSVNLKTGAGLETGDVLVNTANHTAMYVGGGKIVQARSNLDGKAGDSSGQEIREQGYYNYPWDTVLRYTADSSPAQNAEIPVVDAPATEKPKTETVYSIKLPLVVYGDKGAIVHNAQLLLIGNGYKCGWWGADGEFGDATLAAVKKFQSACGITVDGEIGGETWNALFGIQI